MYFYSGQPMQFLSGVDTLPNRRSQIGRDLNSQEVAEAALLEPGMFGHVFHSVSVPFWCTDRKENRIKSNML
jgi:hypothetical protein